MSEIKMIKREGGRCYQLQVVEGGRLIDAWGPGLIVVCCDGGVLVCLMNKR